MNQTPTIPWSHALVAALLLTALNAAKPATNDDSSYLSYAAEFARHPLDPYGFAFGSPYAAPANDLLVPPVLPYWLAAGIALFGDDLILLKLWLFPFALVLAGAVGFLAARFAPPLRVPLLWFAVISPTVLPGFNCMLDVPALALGLAGLALAIRSVERDSWRLVLAAGLLGGLAIQTKYTAVVPCAAAALWCPLHRRPVRGAVLFGVALAAVVGWEMLVAKAQGESHFMIHLRQRQGKSLDRALHLLLPLVSHMAGLAPAVALLVFTALGWSGRRVLHLGLAMLAAFAVLAAVPSQEGLVTGSSGKAVLTPSNLVYALLAVPVGAAFFLACRQALRACRSGDGFDWRIDAFLLAWIVLEVGGYFALSPFPAARRVNGLLLVFTLLAGRLAYRQAVAPRVVGRLAAAGAALSLLIFAADLLDARAARAAARQVAERAPAAGGTYWHLGWGGFGYYADRAGLLPLQLNRRRPRPGDLLALHDVADLRAALARHPEIALDLIATVEVGDAFPLRAAPGYHSGRTPLENQSGPRIRVFVYRVAGKGE